MRRFVVVPDHYLGEPAVVDRDNGSLVDLCPDEQSADRVADALEELLVAGQLHAALPVCDRLEGQETNRVMRYLAKLSRNYKKYNIRESRTL